MIVLLPQPIESEAITLLEDKNCNVITAPDPKPETVLPLLKDAHGLILRTGISITRDLISAAEELLVISRTGGGLDNVDVAAASENGTARPSGCWDSDGSAAKSGKSVVRLLR